MSELPRAEKLAYSVAEACAALSIGKTSLYALIGAKRLKVVRIGGRTVIPANGLHSLLLKDNVKPDVASNEGCV